VNLSSSALRENSGPDNNFSFRAQGGCLTCRYEVTAIVDYAASMLGSVLLL